MKKVIVIGCPGSGKSTFARALREKTGLPLYHLDMLYWNADRTTVEKSVFRARLAAIIEGDEWIIDGNYGSTMELRLAACDTVFFLDYPTDVCLDGVRARRGTPRSDMPWIETEEDAEFTEFIKSYNSESRPRVLELLEKYSDKTIHVFESREEAYAFLMKNVTVQ
ncbi:MAG: adenylate kinase [Clostridia bacterium]|nr:adenylate kinase [Clostridia bacterium]